MQSTVNTTSNAPPLTNPSRPSTPGPSLSSSKPTPHLPPELIEAITSHLHDDHPSLTALALTSHSFTAPAQQYLFHRLHFPATPRTELQQPPLLVLAKYHRLDALLAANPALARCVRHVVLLRAERTLAVWKTVEGMVARILGRLGCVGRLTLGNVEWGWLSRDMRRAVRGLGLGCRLGADGDRVGEGEGEGVRWVEVGGPCWLGVEGLVELLGWWSGMTRLEISWAAVWGGRDAAEAEGQGRSPAGDTAGKQKEVDRVLMGKGKAVLRVLTVGHPEMWSLLKGLMVSETSRTDVTKLRRLRILATGDYPAAAKLVDVIGDTLEHLEVAVSGPRGST